MITVTITSNAAEVAEQMRQFPEQMLTNIGVALVNTNAETVGRIQQERLTGTGPRPFPPDEGRLRLITGTYRQRLIWEQEAEISGGTVSTMITAGVAYAAPQEFGFYGTVQVPEYIRRVKSRNVYITDAPMKYIASPLLASGVSLSAIEMDELGLGEWRTGRKRRRLARRGLGRVRAHTMRMALPARAPIRHGIEDQIPRYREAVSEAILAAWNGGRP